MCFFYLKVLLIYFFPIYRTSGASSDEMELWGSLDSSQLQILNFFQIKPYFILSIIQVEKQKTMPLPYAILNTNKRKKMKLKKCGTNEKESQNFPFH